MLSMCNNIGCQYRSTCYTYLRLPDTNQVYIDRLPPGKHSDECDSYLEVDENDEYLPVSHVDKIHGK